MPPRYAYWTILIDNKPTAFRSRDEEELLPTLNQLRRKNSDVVMKWFARGRLWDTPEQAQWAGKNPEGSAEKRGKGWRPGGQHKDPRARFDKRKKAKQAAAAQSFGPAHKKAFRPVESQEQDRPWRDKKPSRAQGQGPSRHTGPTGERPGRDSPAPGAAKSGPPWHRKPPAGAGSSEASWRGKPPSTAASSAPATGAAKNGPSWRGKIPTSAGAGRRPPWTGKPPSGASAGGRPPWTGKPPSGASAGSRPPWAGKPPSGASAGSRPPWAGKPQSGGSGGRRSWGDKPGPRAAKGGRPGREPRAHDNPAPGAAQDSPGGATPPRVRLPGAGDSSSPDAGLAHRPGAQDTPKLQKGEERQIEPERTTDPADRG